VLRACIESGTPYFGSSAGAILVGRDISTALDDENTIGCLDLSGLGLMGDDLIGCHLRPEKEIRFRKLAERQGVTILAIPETAAIVVEHGELSVIGHDTSGVTRISESETTTYSCGTTFNLRMTKL
jgi:peptidase E